MLFDLGQEHTVVTLNILIQYTTGTLIRAICHPDTAYVQSTRLQMAMQIFPQRLICFLESLISCAPKAHAFNNTGLGKAISMHPYNGEGVLRSRFGAT